jgi:ABC-type sugar transport system ATPase subunit
MTGEPTTPHSGFIEARGLVKRYPGVLALDEVDLNVSSGEVLGLVGKNGAGKSTLIKVLAGAVKPDAGQLLIDGQEIALRDPHHATELGMSVVHQELLHFPALSVAENVELGLGFPKRWGLFVDWPRLRRRSAEVLALLESGIDPRAPVGALPIAQQRLVLIARAFVREARSVILDEPTASLTEEEIAHLHQVIRRLRDHGIGVVYVSHRLDEIFGITDRVVVMRDGRVVADKPTESLDRSELIGQITGQEAATSASDRRRVWGIGGRPDSQVVLQVENLTQPETTHSISFDVREGEVLGIAGLVGSGRTEMARLIFGAERRAGGRIVVKGREARINSPVDAIAAGLALLPEDRIGQGNILDFPLRHNITLARLPEHRVHPRVPAPSAAKEQETSRQAMQRLAIKAPHDRQPVKFLSGGNQQKVVLAKWLTAGADVFIFDEPTQGVDVEGKEEVYLILHELAREGKGIVFISSEFSELVGVCHRVLVMDRGRVVAELEGDAVSEQAIVELCYRSG